MFFGVSAIIFDVYDTLFHNQVDLWKASFARICRDQRLDVDSDILWERWKAHEVQVRDRRVNVAHPELSPPFATYWEIWQRCFRNAMQDSNVSGDPAAAADALVRDMAEREPYPEVFPVLADLRGRYRMAVLSNADDDFLRPLLSRYDLPFEAVLSSEEVRAYKPHPGAFQQVLQRLGTTSGQCLYVGDSPYDDVQGAKLVGMPVVWVNRKGLSRNGLLPAPDYEISDLRPLPLLLESTQEVASHDKAR